MRASPTGRRRLLLLLACAAAGQQPPPPAPAHRHSTAWARRAHTNATVALRRRWAANATANSSALRFAAPRCAAAWPAHTAASCPVEDLSYCDEFRSLDADCTAALTLAELRHCASMSGAFVRAEVLQGYRAGSYLRLRGEARWSALHARFDEDGDGNLTLLDWLAMRGRYAHPMPSCGAALADARYSGRTAMPIRPCEGCAEHWLACEQRLYGGGWTLVYQTAGAVAMHGAPEREPSLLYTHGWRHRERDGDGVLADVPRDDDWRSYAPASGKLSDDAIRALCDGQFMVVTPGRPPTFCALDDASSYSDGALSAKHCLDRRYHTRGEYSRYANASAAAHHGLAPVRKTSVLPAGAFSLCSRWPSP